jgi:hypothetical protein
MKVLHEKVLMEMADRKVWEGRQRLWYVMRHDGLPRRNKPFPGAADMHFPLIDTSIEKLKPFYFNQAFAGETLATFVGQSKETANVAAEAGEAFDYILKQKTNFEDKLLSAIDTMLSSARGIIKVFWDPNEKKLCYETKNPLFIVVAKGATSFDDADWFCEIKPLSVAQYRRNENYRQDEQFIKRIRGGSRESSLSEARQEKFAREGLTYSSDSDQILLFEHYTKTNDGWVVREWAANAPEISVRKSGAFRLPFKFQGKPFQPFVSCSMEVKDEGWYSPRGVAERLAPFEASLCKMWNEKHDCMSFYNKPLFGCDEDLPPNVTNLGFRPGQIYPHGIKPLQMPEPPFSFDQEINSTRNIAEQSIAIPDAGIAPGPGEEQSSQFATATQVEFQKQLASTGVDLKGRIFRKALGEIYKKSWALLLMYAGKELSYQIGNDLKMLPTEALKDAYDIQPSGSPDMWNKQQKFQRAAFRFQTFKGDPGIDQDNLRKDLISSDDPRLVEQLVIPTQQRAENEERDEAEEILLLLAGFPAPARPGEDHVTRLNTIKGYLEVQEKQGNMIPPVSMGLLQDHFQQHLFLLKKENPQAFQQFMQGGGPAPMPGAPTAGETHGSTLGNVMPMPATSANPLGGEQIGGAM